MPVKIPKKLPATKVLTNENIFIMDETRASTQDIRPLKIVILNLMPTKIVTETQLLRLLSNTPLQIDVVFLRPENHESKNTSKQHLETFYQTFDSIKDSKFDGMIITGAPIEMLQWNQVNYWNELVGIMDWTKTHVFSTMHICWAAQAGLFHHYGIEKTILSKKMFGIYSHRVLNPMSKLVRGFDDTFKAPHSRYTGVDKEAILKCDKLQILTESKLAGVHIVTDTVQKNVFVTGHFEYDLDTLSLEYERDLKKGLDTDVPYGYYKDNDPNNKPVFTWRAHANLLFQNWLNYYVYQETPYDISKI